MVNINYFIMKANLYKNILLGFILVPLLATINPKPSIAKAETSISPSWTVSGGMNGSLGGIRASSIIGDDLILVGRFNHVGPSRRGGQLGFSRNAFLILDKNTGSPSMHDFDPQVNGSIEAIDCDGGTCVVAGGFNRFNGIPVNQIAKFNALTGKVDENFRPWLIYQGSYSTLLFRNGIVYAGGDFTSFQNASGQIINRAYLAAFGSAGQLTNWNPGANGPTYKLRMSPDSTIFAAGAFTAIGGSNRQGFAEINSVGAVTKFNPAPPVSVAGVVGRDIGFYNKNIILAGHFLIMAGNTHNGLAMVTPDGNDTSWNAQTNFNETVRALAINKNSLFISFDTYSIGGQPRKKLAELSLLTGQVAPFRADVEVEAPYSDDIVGIRDIQVVSDRASRTRQIYVVGLYTGIAGAAQPNAAYLTSSD
jgi:hypothetical protein